MNPGSDGSLRKIQESAKSLVPAVLEATDASGNEANLRHEIEHLLRLECQKLSIPYAPYQFERPLRGAQKHPIYADVVHGGVIIEYESPGSFSAGRAAAKIGEAQSQAEEYAERMAYEEGRLIHEYKLIVWDGRHIAFGAIEESGPLWEAVAEFHQACAERFLALLKNQGRPMVHPGLLRTMIGPESDVGTALIPPLFEAVLAASQEDSVVQSKTALLFNEWRRMFGQAVGVSTDRLEQLLARQSLAHKQPYEKHVPSYLFALHTFIAVVAKLVSALALPGASQNILEFQVNLRTRMRALESGSLFLNAGIENMLAGDFFSWPVDDRAWPQIGPPLNSLLTQLGQLSFDMTKRNPESVRDLFKGIYQELIPRELRHALGEIYTPDWLAGHTLDRAGWRCHNDLLDPTCGTGTFILEAVRRRLMDERDNGERRTAKEVLQGLHGMDLNPLAVLAAKASLVVVLADRLETGSSIVLPIYLADAINVAEPSLDGSFSHLLQTEKGVLEFRIPAKVAHLGHLHRFFRVLREQIDAGMEVERILSTTAQQVNGLSDPDLAVLRHTIEILMELHGKRWDGIWCPLLADRFAAGAIPKLSHIAGNPPWIKWSHLPDSYAEFIKPHCKEMNVFSEATYTGGIQSDMSTVITFQAVRKWLAPGGRLAFLITATVFSNESSQGFRRFSFPNGRPMCGAILVEDFKDAKPFSGVTNHPALLVVEEGRATKFPVPYRIWSVPSGRREFSGGEEFRDTAKSLNLLAKPVGGTDAGPWVRGTREQHGAWNVLLDASFPSAYRARKGVTTDRNGIFFLKVDASASGSEAVVAVQNDPGAGKIRRIQTVTMDIEATHIFPLLRGRGLRPFCAEVDPKYRLLLPQRGMHGDPDLLADCPKTLRFLAQFKEELQARASYRRYQKNQPFWSTWSTGPYTFSPFKVLWREMSGGRFCAAYVGSMDDPLVGRKVVVPDHKLYMVPVDTLEEAQFLTGILNAPTVATAVGAYAAQLSLGTSVIEYLRIPRFQAGNPAHREIAEIASNLTDRGVPPAQEELAVLDEICMAEISANARRSKRKPH